MGRLHTTTHPHRTAVVIGVSPLVRAADLLVAAAALLLAAPLMGVLAIAVRLGSHGPVLHREPGVGRDGRRVTLLAFRTGVDGAGTAAHAALRGVIGAPADATLTGVGRLMRRTRTDRLPRLLNVLAGHRSLFG